MIERTQLGDEPRQQDLDRRLVLGGGACLLAGAGAAHAQTVPSAPPAPTSQDPRPQDSRPQDPPAAALALSANLLTRMAASVRVNGRRSLLFVLDTGAERTAIAADLAETLKLPAERAVVVHGVTSAQPTPTARIERLHFGRRRFDDLIVPVFDRAMMGADGLLGLDVLSEFRLSLDLQRRRVALTPSGPAFFSIARGSVIPTRLPGGTRTRADESGQLILTNAFADGVPTQSFIDSGGQYSIGSMALLEASGGRVSERPIPLYGVTGQVINAYAGRLRALRIGRYEMGPTPLLFADLHAFDTLGLGGQPAMLIGADILYRFRRVDLDYGARRIGLGGLLPRTPPPAA